MMTYHITTIEQLSHALRSARKAKGLRQDAAGKPVGLLPKTISALENQPGTVTIESFFKLLSALELDLALSPKRKDRSGDESAMPCDEEW